MWSWILRLLSLLLALAGGALLGRLSRGLTGAGESFALHFGPTYLGAAGLALLFLGLAVWMFRTTRARRTPQT
jgi:hypothetical protein